MNEKAMKILIIEDDAQDCQNFYDSLKKRNDFELIAITDSDVEALKYVSQHQPEGIVLDIELNNSSSGNTDSLDFLENMKRLHVEYQPIIIVTTHINSKRIYDILHKSGVDLILYKDQPNYSANLVLNRFITLRNSITNTNSLASFNNEKERMAAKISDCISHELDLIGVTPNLKGRKYIHDAILYIIQNKNSENMMQYLSKKYSRSANTIVNGIQNAIIHAWRVSSIDDLSTYYTAKVNYETGIPTPMEFLYYYVDKVKKQI